MTQRQPAEARKALETLLGGPASPHPERAPEEKRNRSVGADLSRAPQRRPPPSPAAIEGGRGTQKQAPGACFRWVPRLFASRRWHSTASCGWGRSLRRGNQVVTRTAIGRAARASGGALAGAGRIHKGSPFLKRERRQQANRRSQKIWSARFPYIISPISGSHVAFPDQFCSLVPVIEADSAGSPPPVCRPVLSHSTVRGGRFVGEGVDTAAQPR
jgi:hypothetical protein